MLCSPSARAGRIGACLLLEFLRIGGHLASQRFGRQFVKGMNLIRVYVQPKFEALKQKNPEGIAAAVAQLNATIQSFYENNLQYPEPEGRQMKQKESELSQDV